VGISDAAQLSSLSPGRVDLSMAGTNVHLEKASGQTINTQLPFDTGWHTFTLTVDDMGTAVWTRDGGQVSMTTGFIARDMNILKISVQSKGGVTCHVDEVTLTIPPPPSM
jgi:hypothetical protein